LNHSVGIENAFDFNGFRKESDKIGADNKNLKNTVRPFNLVELMIIDTFHVHIERGVILRYDESLYGLVKHGHSDGFLLSRVLLMPEERIYTSYGL
jgi:hypothetical protein